MPSKSHSQLHDVAIHDIKPAWALPELFSNISAPLPTGLLIYSLKVNQS